MCVLMEERREDGDGDEKKEKKEEESWDDGGGVEWLLSAAGDVQGGRDVSARMTGVKCMIIFFRLSYYIITLKYTFLKQKKFIEAEMSVLQISCPALLRPSAP